VKRSFSKRAFDLLLVIAGLVFIWPLLVLLTCLVWAQLGRPVLFVQQRSGLHGKPLRLYKFRTMTDARSCDGLLLPDAERLTPLGKFLRRTSLDELPELFNVIKGDLSLVGPRPLFVRYLPYFTEREQLRHTVKPGITGWAQINGRNYLPWDERLALDVWYVENWSLWLDFKILMRTVVKVIAREGVSADPDEVETDLDQERRGRNQPVSAPKEPVSPLDHSEGKPK
jgi:lipopolysaccharide/colanic/teichoic acid biosynthesis glycosyltransferase